jgi:hypothetical protein
MRQIAGPALTDERHGNISLNNEQHLFTPAGIYKNVRKKVKKALELGANCAFCYVETSGTDGMKVSKTTTPFLKTAACPASATLLSFRSKTLSGEAEILVTKHLEACDFCNAELPLLAHHRPVVSINKTPEIPMNLRILAESILAKN